MEKEAKPFLEIEGLTVERSLGFGERGVGLRDVSLTIFENEIFVIGGEAGSGKSMLCHLILGALEPRTRVLSGSIRLAGEDLFSRRDRNRRAHRRRLMSYIGRKADEAFNPERTVRQSLREAVRLGRREGDVVEEKDWSDVFYSVGIVEPERILSRSIGELSLLLVQKVALMRGLISGAKLLLCDDATTGLDRVAEAQFLELVQQLREERGLTVIMAMGSLRSVERFADRAAILYEGGILESGDAVDLLRDPKFQYTRDFLASTPKLSDHPRELPTISREAIREAEEVVHRAGNPSEGILKVEAG